MKSQRAGFECADVPVEYVHYYMDNVHNLHAFLSDYPSVTRKQVFAAIEERLQEEIDSILNSDRLYVSGTPRFNGTRMTVYTMFNHLAAGDSIAEFVSHYDTSVTVEQCAKLVRLAKLLVEFYAYKIAFDRMDDNLQIDEGKTGRSPDG